MQRKRYGGAAPLAAAVMMLGVLAAGANGQSRSEFPDAWYFYESKRPDEYRSLEGRPARPLKLTGWIGEPQDLKALRGKVVVVDFWATWCKPCRDALPKNVKLVEKYQDQGLVLIGVHDSKRGSERMAAMARKVGINYPLAIDVRRASEQAWRIRFWPSYFIIDREGVVRAAGLMPDHVEDVVKVLLQEPAPEAAPKPASSGKSVSYEIQGGRGEGAADADAPIGTTDGDIPGEWLEGRPQDRRRLAGLLAEGTPPPIKSNEWLNSEPLDLASLRGKVVMVDFWGTWCAPCLASIPKINKLHHTYKDDGLVIIGVCDHRKVERMGTVVKERGIEYPVCADPGGNLTRAYRVSGFPDYYFIDRSGRLRVADVRNDRIEDVIKVLLAEPDPTVGDGDGDS